jgi:hypothetical protein
LGAPLKGRHFRIIVIVIVIIIIIIIIHIFVDWFTGCCFSSWRRGLVHFYCCVVVVVIVAAFSRKKSFRRHLLFSFSGEVDNSAAYILVSFHQRGRLGLFFAFATPIVNSLAPTSFFEPRANPLFFLHAGGHGRG